MPNGLLEALGSGRFTPLGQSEPVQVRGEPPLVVITTNEERVLPNAFVRRCLVLELKLPGEDSRLVDHLVSRAAAHFPQRAAGSEPLFRKAADLLVADRRAARDANLSPLPGQAEYLDLLRGVPPGARRRGPPGSAPRGRVAIRRPQARAGPAMKDVLTGRVDLVRAFATGGTELQDAVARLLGMERLPPEPTLPVVAEGPATPPAPVAEPPVPVVDTTPIPFWAAQSFAVLEPLVPLVQTIVAEQATADAEAAHPPDRIGPTFGPLAPAPTILTGLRRVSAFSRTGAEPDVPRIIEQLSRGRFPGALPRRSRKSWGRSIQVVIDRHGHLAPYWDDQGDVVRALSRLYPRDGFQVAVLPEGEREPRPCWPRQGTTYRFPDPGTTVLALSDLGCLARDGDGLRGLWLDLGRRYRENGNRPLALVPCDAAGRPRGRGTRLDDHPLGKPDRSRVAMP